VLYHEMHTKKFAERYENSLKLSLKIVDNEIS
jgi:hypothetical protein